MLPIIVAVIIYLLIGFVIATRNDFFDPIYNPMQTMGIMIFWPMIFLIVLTWAFEDFLERRH